MLLERSQWANKIHSKRGSQCAYKTQEQMKRKIPEKVVLKIIKHYQEEGQGNEVVQGVLLGLVVDDRLEITNCFPFPQHTEDDADFDEGPGQPFDPCGEAGEDENPNKMALEAAS
ncbi:eukaryotic translation initiation factor 3 subunit h [Limosa lapponica baueri]|uniref:Eukaryotic translation initiation factor 3 subunit h n=1 Tax=Limosa lapponica baueri TaxID=1758121 RepID=A0A2I0UU81_LIMLA|nr:eukaryotic translation initiation factor 3 subunit h [Limosa lapponica baueri]